MIEIVRIGGPAWIQDGGRAGHMHLGIPHGGALVPEALTRANTAIGNEPTAAAIERFGPLGIRACKAVRLADDERRIYELTAGQELMLPWDHRVRVRYLAVEGGIDVPIVYGSRGTLLVAGIGGLNGRPLRKGDRLATGTQRDVTCALVPAGTQEGAIRLLPGPDLDAFAPDALTLLTSIPWRLSVQSDRTGTRLEGPPIPWRHGAPPMRTTPMIAGAIELPPSGKPIVLGPDHPTTGGYPVVALVARHDLGRFHAIPLGSYANFCT